MCTQLTINGRGVGFVCGDGKVKFCGCGLQAVALCDWKIPSRDSGTCDKPMCARHAKQVGRGKHLCPEHQLAWDAWQRRHPPAQPSLFDQVERDVSS
jgi:hypothetical protein